MTAPDLDAVDRRILNCLQHGFPICERPFAEVGRQLGLSETALIDRLAGLLDSGLLSRFGPLYNVERMGGAFTLAAMAVPEVRFDEVAQQVNSFPEVAHNYRREHRLNMWFVIACERPEEIAAIISAIESACGLPVIDLPKEEEFFLELKLTA